MFVISLALATITSTAVLQPCTGTMSWEEYKAAREEALKEDFAYLLGGSLKLSPKEEEVNKILMSYKEKEFDEGLNSHIKVFHAADHFFHVKNEMETSNVFRIIEMIPKGTNLHYHLDSSIDAEFIVRNITKWPHLHYCYEEQNFVLFRFFESYSSSNCSSSKGWESVEKLRSGASGQEYIDRWFLKSLSMYERSPEFVFRDSNQAWVHFEKRISSMVSIMRYEKAYREGLYEAMRQHYEDNVMYMEHRIILPMLYHLNQTILSKREVLQLVIDVVEQFKKDYPDFWGAKLIYAPHRFRSNEEIHEIITDALELKKEFPEYLIGFDLVGQEDKGTPLFTFGPELLKAHDGGLNFYFHAGETDWYGTRVDENLVDAVLLNASRLAHGFALFRHTRIYNLVKERGIAVEVCPISNQILRYIEDLRVHPATTYFVNGFPVVVASDDPGIWGAKPMSHDWYMAFMALAGRRADLKTLKQLAINSIQYSGMSPAEKVEAMKKWEVSWDKFLNKVLKSMKPATKSSPSYIISKNRDADADTMFE